MGHYDEQYEAMYEEERKYKEGRQRKITENLLREGVTQREIDTFKKIAKALRIWEN